MNGLNNHECSRKNEISFKKFILEPKIFHRQNYDVIKIFPADELISPPLQDHQGSLRTNTVPNRRT